ncbi:MAG: retroviral-like aspartic protease family protein [Armatimonadota bacterium]|nr:retroviral-like aspartic protease family protein [Armatimonadota bacterium]MDW8143667.1 retroviral-like aspartic protease family protein [Armatimonadota bacterium]
MQQMQTETAEGEKVMGRVTARLRLENAVDFWLAQTGQISPEQIRTVEVDGLVDTGATLLVIPKSIADRLGVPEVRRTTVRYADQRVAEKPVVGPLRVTVCNRAALFEAVVEEQLNEPLIGQIVLESLDLVVSPRELTLMPNPRSPDLPMIDIL